MELSLSNKSVREKKKISNVRVIVIGKQTQQLGRIYSKAIKCVTEVGKNGRPILNTPK